MRLSSGERTSTARRTVGSGVSIATAFGVGSAAAGGVTTLVVARLVGADGVGVYSVVLATASALALLFSLGLDAGALYHVSGRRWLPGRATVQLQLAALALGGLAIGLGMALCLALRDTVYDGVAWSTVLIGLALIPSSLSWTFGSNVALALDRYERYALAPFIQSVCGLLLAVALVPSLDVRGALAAVAVSHGISAIWVWGRGRRETRSSSGDWRSTMREDLRMAAAYGARANSARVLSLVIQRADILVLGAFAASGEVGAYSIAVSMTALQVLLPTSISMMVAPRVSALDSDGLGDDRDTVALKSIRHAFLASVVTGAAMAAALLLVPPVFGDEFADSVRLGWILVPGVAAFGLASVVEATILGRGHPRDILRGSLVAAPITLALYFVTIPAFGANGAAVSSTISYLLILALFTRYFLERFPDATLRSLIPGGEELRDYQAFARGLRRSGVGR